MAADDPVVAHPFDTIEGAREFVTMLCEAVRDAQKDIQQEIGSRCDQAEQQERTLEALHLIRYKLDRLAQHLLTSRRLLKDLGALSRILNTLPSDAASSDAAQDAAGWR